MAKILVIEDEAPILDNIVESFSMVGFEVDAASNGATGVRMAKELNPDVIICDIMMPELDGWGVFHALQEDEVTASIPVIFLTALADREFIERAQKMGVSSYVIKPFNLLDLVETVNKCLNENS